MKPIDPACCEHEAHYSHPPRLAQNPQNPAEDEGVGGCPPEPRSQSEEMRVLILAQPLTGFEISELSLTGPLMYQTQLISSSQALLYFGPQFSHL